jgi:hypothetical protein
MRLLNTDSICKRGLTTTNTYCFFELSFHAPRIQQVFWLSQNICRYFFNNNCFNMQTWR